MCGASKWKILFLIFLRSSLFIPFFCYYSVISGEHLQNVFEFCSFTAFNLNKYCTRIDMVSIMAAKGKKEDKTSVSINVFGKSRHQPHVHAIFSTNEKYFPGFSECLKTPFPVRWL